MKIENEIYTLLERFNNLLKVEARSKGAELGLQPVQHDSLHYLSICNSYSDHLQALTQFLGLTKGTVSQSIKIMQEKGLIDKKKDQYDKRLIHLNLSEKGWAYITAATPLANFASTLSSMSAKQQENLLFLLRQCLFTYQNFNNVSGYGVCKDCRYNRRTTAGFHCKLLKQDLMAKDIEKICVEFEA